MPKLSLIIYEMEINGKYLKPVGSAEIILLIRDRRNLKAFVAINQYYTTVGNHSKEIYKTCLKCGKNAEVRKSDLLEIADAGEYEDLRREVENYFN